MLMLWLMINVVLCNLNRDGFSIEAVRKGHIFHLNESGHPQEPVVATFGFAGFFGSASTVGIKRGVVGGLNTEGLSCDMQTLIDTSYPPFPQDPSVTTPVNAVVFCEWALASFSNTAEVKAALTAGADSSPAKAAVYGADVLGQHFVLRDAQGASLVAEFLEGTTLLHDDGNDDGVTGFGIFTNEPPFPWHVANTKHYDWKKTLARSAVAVPGGFYPDERFLRLHALKVHGLFEDKIKQEMQKKTKTTTTICFDQCNHRNTYLSPSVPLRAGSLNQIR
jgi:penicillin V acylase-like amidase (Ntn superfamily)